MKQDMLQGRGNNPICFDRDLEKGWVTGQEGGCLVFKGVFKRVIRYLRNPNIKNFKKICKIKFKRK